MISPLRVLSLVLATATAISATLSAPEIVSSIEDLTAKSLALQAPAKSITLINGPLIVIGLGPFPQIISGFASIVATVTVDITKLQGTKPFKVAAEEKAIADALVKFVEVHQALLNILIGKAGLFTLVPVIGEPVAAILRQIEKVVDTVAFALIDLIPDEKSSTTLKLDSFDVTITEAVSKYQGLVKRSYPVDFRG